MSGRWEGSSPIPTETAFSSSSTDGPRGSLRYGIENTDQLWRESSDGGVRLEISSSDGSTMIVECHPAGH